MEVDSSYEYNIWRVLKTGIEDDKDTREFIKLREIMDHYFYRMTTRITDSEISSFMCGKGTRRTGMSFFTSPWADPYGISMMPKWYELSCSSFT